MLVLDTSTDHPDDRDEEECWEDSDDEEAELEQLLDCTDLVRVNSSETKLACWASCCQRSNDE